MTLTERVEVSAGRIDAGARGGGAGLRANDGTIAGTAVVSGSARRGAGRGDDAIDAAVAGFGTGADACEGIGPGAAVARGGVPITGVAALAPVTTDAEAEAGVEALARAGARVVGVAIGAPGRAPVAVCAAVVKAGVGAAAGFAAGGRAIAANGVGAAAPDCAGPAFTGVAATPPDLGPGAGMAAGWAAIEDFVVDGGGHSGFALLGGGSSRAGAGAGAELTAGFGAFVDGTGAVCEICTRASAGVAALPAWRCIGVGSGVCGMGDRSGDSAGDAGLTGSFTSACESRADGASMGTATGVSRERRGAAGLSVVEAFVLAGARFGRGATSVVAIALFFGATRRRAGFAGAAVSSGAAGSAFATVALRLRSGFGRSVSSIVRV